MGRVRRRPRWRARLYIPLVLAASALLPSTAAAQSKTARSDQTLQPAVVRDSAHAVATACAIVQSLRQRAERAQCVIENVRETRSEYVVRVREQALPGTLPRLPSHSVVRLKKTGIEATVTREPEL